MAMYVPVLPVGVPTVNGRIYPKEVVEEALKKFRASKIPILGGTNLDGQPRLDDISHQVKNLRIEGNAVIADIEILPTPKGKILRKLLGVSNVPFSMVGVGKLQENGDGTKTVTDYDVTSISAILGEITPGPELIKDDDKVPLIEIKPELGNRKLVL